MGVHTTCVCLYVVYRLGVGGGCCCCRLRAPLGRKRFQADGLEWQPTQCFHQATTAIHHCPSSHSGKDKLIKLTKILSALERRACIDKQAALSVMRHCFSFFAWLWQELVALHPTARVFTRHPACDLIVLINFIPDSGPY